MLKPSVTINDVARAAGVSMKTVSRVVNNEVNVKSSTRESVYRAIATLGYRPNPAARALASSRSFMIGLINSFIDSYYFHEIHNQAVRACREKNFHLVVEEFDLNDPNAIQHLEDSIVQMRLEGVILTLPSAEDPRVIELLERHKVRYVSISPRSSHKIFSTLRYEGIELIADHLWSLGHRHIVEATTGDPQLDLLRSALLARGCDSEKIISLPLHWEKGVFAAGHDLAAQILALPTRPTAVFAFNDEIAASVINYAWAHGIRVPDDLSVVGFDDNELARNMWPPITTVRMPLAAITQAAIDILTAPDKSANSHDIAYPPVEFIVRKSTAKIAL